jgi:hypothetical protein
MAALFCRDSRKSRRAASTVTEGTTCGNAFSTAQSAAAILTTSQWRELKQAQKWGDWLLVKRVG